MKSISNVDNFEYKDNQWMLSYTKTNIAGKEIGLFRLDYNNGTFKVWQENDFLKGIHKIPPIR